MLFFAHWRSFLSLCSFTRSINQSASQCTFILTNQVHHKSLSLLSVSLAYQRHSHSKTKQNKKPKDNNNNKKRKPSIFFYPSIPSAVILLGISEPCLLQVAASLPCNKPCSPLLLLPVLQAQEAAN